MIEFVSIFSIGFSIIIAILLFIVYAFFLKHENKTWITILTCGGLLGGLAAAQYFHYTYYVYSYEPLSMSSYRFLILFVPPMFYFFSRSILFPDRKMNALYMLHFLPILTVFLAPMEVAAPIAFFIGTGYSLWLTNIVYHLRNVRKRFRLVFYFFGFFSVVSVIVLITGFAASNFNIVYFYHFYTNSIAASFVLVTATLIVFPDVLNDIDEVVRLGYSNSTLGNLDVNECIKKLHQLMSSEKMYQNENLSLAILADEMNISNHQLSELINTQFDFGFSQYIRTQRVEAAKELLKKETNSSILSISMEVGFKTQSNFYAAFKEITGESPGNYRKLAES